MPRTKVERGKLLPGIYLFDGNSHEMKEEGQMKHSKRLFLRATSTMSRETFHRLPLHSPEDQLPAAPRAGTPLPVEGNNRSRRVRCRAGLTAPALHTEAAPWRGFDHLPRSWLS